MRSNRFSLLVPAMLAVAVACVQPAKIDSPPEYVPPAHLAVRIEGSAMDIAGQEINMTPGDSLRLRAIVENRSEAYGTPVITSADPSFLELLPDGTYRVKRFGTLNLTATALAKSPNEQPQTLSAFSTLRLVCTAEMRAGIRLTVRDSVTGALIPSARAQRFRVTSATRVDSAVVSASGTLILSGSITPGGDGKWILWESPGTWSVDFDAAGYRPWRRDAVVVPAGLCHAIAVDLTANLQPLSP